MYLKSFSLLSCGDEPAIHISTIFKLPRSQDKNNGLEDWDKITIDEFQVYGENIDRADIHTVVYTRVRDFLSCDNCKEEEIQQRICWMVAHSIFTSETKNNLNSTTRSLEDFFHNNHSWQEISSFVIARSEERRVGKEC